MPAEKLILAGRPADAWKMLEDLPARLKFTPRILRQRLSCALALGWHRRACILEETLSKNIDRDAILDAAPDQQWESRALTPVMSAPAKQRRKESCATDPLVGPIHNFLLW
ncbi:hypothetical protein OKA04_12665 [Luteolibacter flavescens]|uniref:Uncharacterized protein n=1 Tax=Luteolibacter flavescens TaxID=1859460 RepID=A0ABT3FQK0_9BACT|nr:hypothetical protein [Luteolibacter flavescens]MCW1885584.1 hypothetical protein [Luteolibacter flavescens]